MDYQVWIKDEYGDAYTRIDCGDLEAAKREIDKAIRAGREPVLTVGVQYTLDIKVKETVNEADKIKTKPDKNTGAKSNGAIRRGDKTTAPGLDQGSGDNSPDNLPGD